MLWKAFRPPKDTDPGDGKAPRRWSLLPSPRCLCSGTRAELIRVRSNFRATGTRARSNGLGNPKMRFWDFTISPFLGPSGPEVHRRPARARFRKVGLTNACLRIRSYSSPKAMFTSLSPCLSITCASTHPDGQAWEPGQDPHFIQ